MAQHGKCYTSVHKCEGDPKKACDDSAVGDKQASATDTALLWVTERPQQAK